MEKNLKINDINISINLNKKESDVFVVLIHGLQSNKEAFNRIQSDIEKKLDFSTLSIDLVGFGNSEKPDNFPYDLISQATIVKDIFRDLEIRNIILIGHSYGGMISTYLSNQSDLNVLALISLEGNLTKGDCGESMNVSNLLFSDFKPYYNELISKLDNTKNFADQFRADALKRIPDHVFYKSSKTIVDWSVDSNLFTEFINNEIPKLLIIGSNSGFESKPHDKHTTIKILEKTGHFMLLEEQIKTSKVIIDFIRNIKKQDEK
jgi:pimeloyl-ACP methyl ester carboxylesterase